jgi:DNA-binding transcriptional regulator YdaS (Cro superfamily)
MSSFRPHVARAVEIKGSQAKLAADAGCSQQQISYLLNEADSITAEMAIAIDRATNGEVSREQLRPDIFVAREAAA